MESVGRACMFGSVNKDEEKRRRKIDVQCLVVCVSKEFSWIGNEKWHCMRKIFHIGSKYTRVAWQNYQDKMECVNEFQEKIQFIRSQVKSETCDKQNTAQFSFFSWLFVQWLYHQSLILFYQFNLHTYTKKIPSHQHNVSPYPLCVLKWYWHKIYPRWPHDHCIEFAKKHTKLASCKIVSHSLASWCVTFAA